MRRLIRSLASLKLTVTLLALSMVLIFLGTIAQTRLGVWQAVEVYFRSGIAWVDPSLFLPVREGSTLDSSSLRIPIPGGLGIAAVMIVNLLAAHVIKFKSTRQRIGVLGLHAGLVVLLAGEFVTGFMADEGMMSIDEGGRTSFIEDIRTAELAIVDHSAPDTDRVVVVPQAILAHAARDRGVVSHPDLPFEVRVDQWLPNAALFMGPGAGTATAGVGLEAHAVERPQVAGVESSEADLPAAYVTLLRSGREVGTWLVSASLTAPQAVRLADEAYALALRFKRTYLPYTLELIDFRHDVFTGTTIPKNFSSDVRVIDPAHETDREARIWMNNPLRYAGRTFYQASYKPDGSGTVLQVVQNPGWLMPYIACAMVGGGMLLHFVQSLVGFLRNRAKRAAARPGTPLAPRNDPEAAPPLSVAVVKAPRRKPLWPWAVGLCGILIACSAALRPVPSSEYDLAAFGLIPVSAGGRIKPLDTAARSMLMVAGGRQQVSTDDGTVPATRYLLDLIAKPELVAPLPAIRVDHPDVLAMLGLTPQDSGRIGLDKIEPHWVTINQQAERAKAVPARQRDGFQRAILQLHDRVGTIASHARLREPYLVPPTDPHAPWRSFNEAFLAEQQPDPTGTRVPDPAVAHLIAMFTAANSGNAAGFNAALASYTELLQRSMPDVMAKSRLEVLFNRASLFTGATAVYVLAFVGVCASFLLRSGNPAQRLPDILRVGSFSLLTAAVIVHTVALVVRMYLQERPPVTNLYSSAIFVGWAAALCGLFIERLFPLGVATLGSTVVGAATLVIAHNLGNDGDTMEMMQAVLDSNFWLATHVITITLGYSATFLAGTLGIIHILGGTLTNAITRERESALSRMTYGVVCFAMLLSFVGTVLGGIWADQSWGRFWGWDPKENGAALVVLINAIILHARWGGLVKARGIAVLAVAGNIVTAWSWFGTNMLGVGLHAYGFMDSAGTWLAGFVASQLAIMALGMLIRPRPARNTPALAHHTP